MVRTTAMMAIGMLGAGVSTVALAGAAKETLRMTTASLKRVYDDITEEPVPDHLTQLIEKLD